MYRCNTLDASRPIYTSLVQKVALHGLELEDNPRHTWLDDRAEKYNTSVLIKVLIMNATIYCSTFIEHFTI